MKIVPHTTVQQLVVEHEWGSAISGAKPWGDSCLGAFNFANCLSEELQVHKMACVSSLHCNISLSFCSFLYNGVYFNRLKLSVNDVIVNQKRFQWRRKATILWVGLIC